MIDMHEQARIHPWPKSILTCMMCLLYTSLNLTSSIYIGRDILYSKPIYILTLPSSFQPCIFILSNHPFFCLIDVSIIPTNTHNAEKLQSLPQMTLVQTAASQSCNPFSIDASIIPDASQSYNAFSFFRASEHSWCLMSFLKIYLSLHQLFNAEVLLRNFVKVINF